METALSLHMYFDAAAAAYRAIFRIDGMPTIRAAISAPTGSTTYSPFIALAAR
jgi:hypothetical protein